MLLIEEGTTLMAMVYKLGKERLGFLVATLSGVDHRSKTGVGGATPSMFLSCPSPHSTPTSCVPFSQQSAVSLPDR